MTKHPGEENRIGVRALFTHEYDQNGSLIKRTLKTDSTQYREYYYDWDQKRSGEGKKNSSKAT